MTESAESLGTFPRGIEINTVSHRLDADRKKQVLIARFIPDPSDPEIGLSSLGRVMIEDWFNVLRSQFRQPFDRCAIDCSNVVYGGADVMGQIVVTNGRLDGLEKRRLILSEVRGEFFEVLQQAALDRACDIFRKGKEPKGPVFPDQT